jgi:hypothetical protein
MPGQLLPWPLLSQDSIPAIVLKMFRTTDKNHPLPYSRWPAPHTLDAFLTRNNNGFFHLQSYLICAKNNPTLTKSGKFPLFFID